MISAQAVAAARGATGAASSSSSGSSTPMKELDKNAFLKLMVEQLKYQDPMKPMDNQQFIAQMAQFSSLEQMTNVSDGLTALGQKFDQNFGQLTRDQLVVQAMTLVGRNITATNPADGKEITGQVTAVKFVQGSPVLMLGETQVQLANVSQIS